MDINKLEGNSHKSKKGEEPKLPKYDIAVKIKKPNKVAKFAKSIIAEDVKSVSGYILTEVLGPALQKLIVDIVQNGISALVYGQGAPTKGRSSTQKVSYSNAFNSSLYGRTKASEIKNRPVYDMDDIEFESRGDAVMVLEDIKDCLSRDKDTTISVGSLRDSLRYPTTSTDWNYGWTGEDYLKFASIEVERTITGKYIIPFPRIKPLD